MKLPPFGYGTPATLGEALELLAEYGSDAALLAGGQSLLLELRYRDRTPAVLVDLNGIAGLDRISVPPPDAAPALLAAGVRPALEVGALVRHAGLEALGRSGDPAVGPLGRLIGMIAPLVGHPPIRERGTFAGSIAWAHPAAEWCALAVLTDAEVITHGPDRERSIPAERWFTGRQATSIGPDEVVVRIRMPLLAPGTGVGFLEHRRTHGTFALVAAMATVRLGRQDRIGAVRLAFANAGEVPLRARAAEAALIGRYPDRATLRDAAQLAADAADPVPEPHCSPAYRRHAVGVLARRALAMAVADARGRTARKG
jgi:carbon-monoxide dehydrogenase medium subunit